MSKYSLTNISSSLYDKEVAKIGGHFTQSALYYNWQSTTTTIPERFIFSTGDVPKVFMQIFTSPLVGHKNQIHIPHGPIFLTDDITTEEIKNLKEKLRDLAEARQAVFVRLDPQNIAESDLEYLTENLKPTPPESSHTTHTQPRLEWRTDISVSEEKIFSSQSKKTRYAIRTAEKRDSVTKIISQNLISHLDTFYDLLKETAERGQFSLHPKSYYENVLIETEKSGSGFLVISSYDSKALVVNLITLYGNGAYHVFGGSSSTHRDQLATYLAHWAGFVESKKRGSSFYNFGGISDDTTPIESWANITYFKRQFAGEAYDLGPTYDLILLPFWYYLYTIRKKLKKYL